LKEDGSIWSDQLTITAQKNSVGYKDIDTDRLECSYIGLKMDGSVWVWGTNNMGQFAESKLKSSDNPIKIMTMLRLFRDYPP
jgi:alpha-tubulin suppressor-like RCC1 family protein